uniref:Uncharacterized protein n=1 Tax=Eiseniibacteriota bacterium TaxID=2212470 RepID=A0A832I3W6_UNCEI
MTLSPSVSVRRTAAARRAVLIDFDWKDADLIPALLRKPGLSVRLVAGERTDEAGLRIAELCGLPRTVDLADLTREIFDLALVSERSARRTQVEGLLLALGTPSLSPEHFLEGAPESERPAIEAPLALHAAALEHALGGEAFSALVEQALPDLSADAPTVPTPPRPGGHGAPAVQSLDDFPSREDRLKLEAALAELARTTGAGTAELHAGRPDQVTPVVRVGREDPLLRGLVDLALELNQPQVVSRVTGPGSGKLWGAWPFRTTQHRGVLAAAGIGPAPGPSPWEKMVEDLRSTWDRHDRDLAAAAFPMTPEAREGWLGADEFARRVELALERNRRDGMRFALHRLEFPEAGAAFEALAANLPGQLRGTDSICQPAPRVVLLLAAGPAASFLHVRRRLLALWEQCWNDARRAAPAPPLVDQHIELRGPEDAESFLAAAGGWLTGA